jgi:hypothetical protein
VSPVLVRKFIFALLDALKQHILGAGYNGISTAMSGICLLPLGTDTQLCQGPQTQLHGPNL